MAFVDHYIRVYNLNIEEEYFKQVIKNGNIVSKQGPNWLFYAFMLRTKLY